MKSKLAYLYPLLLFLYSIYSFSQTDPNLVLSSNFSFWDFQQQMWQIGYHNRPLSTIIYLFIVISLFSVYGLILWGTRTNKIKLKNGIILFLLSITALLPSYPALSHDIFNYIFNAKMVVVYHENPHIKTALDFPTDPWLKFMHNIHTPAPYGYGWTGLSVIPYLIGNGYLQAELLIFRLLMVGGLVLCLWLLTKIRALSLFQLSLLAFNPLVLIEGVSNIHNDIIMMAAALGGYIIIRKGIRTKNWWSIFAGVILFAFSVSIKYSTILLICAWIAWKLIKKLSLIKWSILSQLIPLVTQRSQRFLQWYLIWSLVFLPLVKDRMWRNALIISSFAGLTSYWLILYYGDYSQDLLIKRSMWLFGIPVLYIIYEKFLKFTRRKIEKK